MADVSEQKEASPFARLGGEKAIRRIANYFYDVMESDPAAAGIRRMHADDLSTMRVKLADWMIGALGGPPLYAERPDRNCMVSVHRAYAIGADAVEQWMACLHQAFEREGVAQDLRDLLDPPFRDLAGRLRSA